MSVDIRLPNINAPTTQGQVAQMQSYMYQLAEQLNWALNTISNPVGESSALQAIKSSQQGMTEEEAIDTFNGIKELIIKSADIVKAYEDKMKLTFDGVYVAESDFGTYAKRTLNELNITSERIDQMYTRTEGVALANDVATIKSTQAWIRTGFLDDGIAGIEVGEKRKIDDQEVFCKFARFTSDGIYFYLPSSNNTNAVAWMTGTKLFISNAEITEKLTLGKYIINCTNGLSVMWGG